MNVPRLSAAWLPLALFVPTMCFGQGVAQLTVGRLAGTRARRSMDDDMDDESMVRGVDYSSFTQQEPNDGEAATERTEISSSSTPESIHRHPQLRLRADKIIVSQSRRDADERHRFDEVLSIVQRRAERVVFGTIRSERVRRTGTGRGAGRPLHYELGCRLGRRAQMTERGGSGVCHPTQDAAVEPGDERTWGVNVMRNIRRKNEQVFLSPVPAVQPASRVGGCQVSG